MRSIVAAPLQTAAAAVNTVLLLNVSLTGCMVLTLHGTYATVFSCSFFDHTFLITGSRMGQVKVCLSQFVLTTPTDRHSSRETHTHTTVQYTLLYCSVDRSAVSGKPLTPHTRRGILLKGSRIPSAKEQMITPAEVYFQVWSMF